MIHVVTSENRAVYARELAQMFAQRAAFFIDRLGWPLTRDPDGGERDGHDDALAIYFLVLDAAGEVLASCRARPLDGGPLLDGVHLDVAIAETATSAREAWALGRILLAPPERPRAPHIRTGELRLAVLEEAVECGVERLVGVVDALHETALMRSGYRIRALGAPGELGGGRVVAFEIDARPMALADLRRRLGLDRARRLRLPPTPGGWASPKEMETFLRAAQRLDRDQLSVLRAALRRAADEEN